MVGFSLYDATDTSAAPTTRPSLLQRAVRSAPALLLAVLLTRLWAVLVTPLTLSESRALTVAQQLAAVINGAASLQFPADLLRFAAWPTLLHALVLVPFGRTPDAGILLLSGRLLAVIAVTAAVWLALRRHSMLLAVLLLLHSLAVLPVVLFPPAAWPLLCLLVVALRLQNGPRDAALLAALLLLAFSQPLWLVPLVPVLIDSAGPPSRRRLLLLLAVSAALPAALLLWRSLLQLPLLPVAIGTWPAWLFGGAAVDRWPDSFLLPSTDALIALVALAAIPVVWRDAVIRPQLIWLLGGAVLLPLLPPLPGAEDPAVQALALLPPLLMVAAGGLRTVWQRFQEWDSYWSWLDAMLPRPPWYAWLLLTLLIGFIAVIYGSAAVTQALGRIGWLQLPPGQALPAAPYRSFALADDRLLLAIDAGLYRAAAAAPVAGSTAAQRAVTLVAAAADVDWWISDGQLVRQSRGAAPQQQALPAAIGRVRAVAAAADGTLLLAAAGGAWQADAALNISRLSQLPPAAMTTVAVGPDDSRWFGAAGSVYRLLPDGSLQTIALNGRTAAVSALLPLADGTLWIGTYGGGLGRWDGSTLQWQLSAANTSLRQITALVSTDGALWVAAANSTAPGGALLRIDGSGARRLTPLNSGFPDAETLSLIVDRAGRLWIATRYDGLLIFGG